MSQCCVPNCNLKQQQRQEQVEQEDNLKSSSHVHNPLIMKFRSNYEVAELTWENGQLAMHGLGGLLPTAQTKPTWSSRAHDTLESIVQQATCQHQKSNLIMPPPHHTPTTTSTAAAASDGMTLPKKSGKAQMAVPMLTRKRTWSESGYCGGSFSSKTKVLEECDPTSSGCASASATFCRDNESTMMSLASYETGRSLKSNKILDQDSPSQNGSENQEQEEDRDTKVEISRSNPARRNRAAAIHNQSERVRRRDRINQKMKALQRLVPNASKTDKASMLDEVIEYLKQLQAQIQMMSTRNIPHQQQMMMMMMPPPLAMQQQQQQQLQMSMLARMGVGLGLGFGMGLPNMNNTSMAVASTGGPPSLPQLTVGAPAIAPTFVMPSLIQAHAHAPLKPEPTASVAPTNASVSLPDPYTTVLSQSVNMDIMNSMAALYRQQIRQKNQALSSLSEQHHGQGV